MSWESGPPDPVEAKDVRVDVCDDCHQLTDDCTCENPSGYTEAWGLECPDCRSRFADEDGWLEHHDCDRYFDEDDYF